MLPGIACGVRKFLLIFNTSIDSPHDPVYVVDPRKFGIEPSTNTPVVLAYDLNHYESMHPVDEEDIQATHRLTIDYLEGKYNFGKLDLPFLLGLEDEEMKLSKIPSQLIQTYKK